MPEVSIPKKLGHIWIGPYDPPLDWMKTWIDKHPYWEYTLYDNNYLENTKFKTQRQIEEYLNRGEYSGVADLMRYEILYEKGGFIANTDSICYHCTDELFDKPCAYTVYENEFLKGQLVSPIMACEPGNEFVGNIIETLSKVEPSDLDRPWKSTGNLFMARMIRDQKPEIIIFPSHYFIPVHFEGEFYTGEEKVYAKELFGSTRNSYGDNNIRSFFTKIKQSWLRKSRARRLKKLQKNNINVFDKDYSSKESQI